MPFRKSLESGGLDSITYPPEKKAIFRFAMAFTEEFLRAERYLESAVVLFYSRSWIFTFRR